MGTFSKQIEAFNKKAEARLRAVARTAVQETVSKAQRTRGEGGRMRVDTGFLRASIQAALATMPVGPSDNPTGEGYKVGSQAAGEPIAATLLKWDPNTQETLFVGWTANYARHREAQDGFLRGAVELWDQTVDNAARKVRAGLG